jgi:hypothetical protein
MEKEPTKELKSHREDTEPQVQEPRDNGKNSGVRNASKEQFEKAQRKTSAKHAGLFRRLAE